MDYPIWDVALGGGTLMAVVAIAHVIVSHFAIGGGLVIVATETLAVRRGDLEYRELARRGSLMLILVSTVFGAISGVGIWVVAGLISPGAISSLIHTYVWGWAIEWTFFLVEIVAALVYYTTWGKISKSAHLFIGWVYFIAAYLSLVVINGIITFMLTPGRWLETHKFWDGFFNPTYWPSLLLRTGICAMMATAFLLFVARRGNPVQRPRLMRYLGLWLVVGAVLAYAGFLWWQAALPDSALALLGGQAALMTLEKTLSLGLWALALAFAGGMFLTLLPRAGRNAVAIVIAVAAFTFFGSYERLREGLRKPFLIHSYLFSNGLLVDDIEGVNDAGLAAVSGWAAARIEGPPLLYGREIYRIQCSSCHTLDGYQAIRPLLPTAAEMLALAADDPPGSGQHTFQRECASCHPDYTDAEMRDTSPGVDEIRDDPEFIDEFLLMMIAGTLDRLQEMGTVYVEAERSRSIDTRQTAYPYMPPLVGSAEDLEALAAFLASLGKEDVAPAQLAQEGGV